MIYHAYELTWDEVLEAAGRKDAVTSIEGYLICSQDRKLDMREGARMHKFSVARAIARGKEVPDKVREWYEKEIIQAGIEPGHAKCAAFDPPPAKEEPIAPLLNAKGKPFSWSPSALGDFLTCPKQYAAKRFYVTLPYVETEAMRQGTIEHKHLEDRLKLKKPLPKGYDRGEKYVRAIEKWSQGGKVYAERQIAIDENLDFTSWFDKTAWGRCVVDVTAVKDGQVSVFDWKGLALDTPLPTPSGWTTMGEVQKGDVVFGADGRPCKVVGKSQTHHRKCFKVTFCDGEEIICDDQHLWQVERACARGSHYKTKVLPITSIYEALQRKERFRVALAEALETPELLLPVDPYVLGCWLGDGKHSDGSVSKPDAELFANIEACGYVVGPPQGNGGDPVKCPTRTVYGLRTQLREAGILRNKHIPEVYFRASRDQRLALLQGLLDTDGYYNPGRKQATFTTTDLTLGRQVKDLAISLGQRPNSWVVNKKGFGKCVKSFDIAFTPIGMNPFRLSRKAQDVNEVPTRLRSYYRIIRSVEEVESVPTQCIAVDSPDSLYLCGEAMIPTHNTGKPKDDTLQLKINTCFLSLEFPEAERFINKFIWLKHDQTSGENFTKDQIPSLWEEVLGLVERVKKAWQTENWPCRPSGLCRGWCDVKDCVHHAGPK